MPYRLLLLHTGAFGENYGVYVQHVETLRWLLADDPQWEVVTMDALHPQLAAAALESDLVIAGMSGAPELESLMRLRRARGLRTIFEITDNFLGLGTWVTPHNLLHSPLARQSVVFHAHLADAVQVYAPPLAELFRGVNERIVVFDPYVPLPDALPEKEPGFVFGWGGTRSHRDDLAAIAPAIAEFCARHDDAVFSYMGDASLFEELFAAIPSSQKRWRAYGDYDDYLEFVRTLHAGLAPLAPSPFNAARSDTKVITYFACGAAAIAQDAAVYGGHRERALLFDEPAALLAHLETLYGDRQLLRALTRSAFEWVRAHRSREALHAQRVDCYRALVPASPLGAPPIDAAPPYAARLGEAMGREPAEALTIVREVLAEAPEYPQAQWFCVRVLEALGREEEALDYADSVAPPPLFADLFAEAQTRLARKVRPEVAESYAARVASPVRRARLAQVQGGEPLAFYRSVLEAQPYDFFALSAVIRLLSKSNPDAPELPALFARAALVAPASVPRDRRPAALEAFLPR
ncbi:MAG TPA: hypothetical protein VF824_23055 [Thermoanaerobaculia bacterium]|jgi:hypothetical protein